MVKNEPLNEPPITTSNPPPSSTKPSAPRKPASQRRIDALEEMAANGGTPAEREAARRKLEEIRRTGAFERGSTLNVGSRVDGARTAPAPHGTTTAAPGNRAAARTAKTEAEVVSDSVAKAGGKVTRNVIDDAGGSVARRTGGELLDIAKNVASRNPREMGIAAAAALLGAGAYAHMRNDKNRRR